MQAVDRFSVQQHSASRLRFLIAVVAPRAFRVVHSSASHYIARPMVVMAAKVLGPGPTRLKLVKLAHNLGNSATVVELPLAVHDGAIVPSETTRRAA